MSLLTSSPNHTTVEQKTSFLTRFIHTELAYLDEIEALTQSWAVEVAPALSFDRFSSLGELHRRLVHEYRLALENIDRELIDDLYADLLHFTAVPSQNLFNLIGFFDHHPQLPDHEKQKMIHAIQEYYRIFYLNQALHLVEQDNIHQTQTAVSLLQCLQKPNTLNKPVCIQISGSGARQSIIGHEILFQTAMDFVFWGLSGQLPNNQIWVDSDLTDTAVTLQIWNDSLTVAPSKLDELNELIAAQSLFALETFEGIIPTLFIAHKLVQKFSGQSKLSAESPSKFEIILPIQN